MACHDIATQVATRYNHILSLLSPMFPPLKDELRGVVALKAADDLVRDAAPNFHLTSFRSRWPFTRFVASQAVSSRDLIGVSIRRAPAACSGNISRARFLDFFLVATDQFISQVFTICKVLVGYQDIGSGRLSTERYPRQGP